MSCETFDLAGFTHAHSDLLRILFYHLEFGSTLDGVAGRPRNTDPAAPLASSLEQLSRYCILMRSDSAFVRFPLKLVFGSVFIVILSSCATPYQPMSALGGYREIRLA